MFILRILRRLLWVAVIVVAATAATIYAARHSAPPAQLAQAKALAVSAHDYGALPSFAIDGLQSSDFKGHRVLLTFFASWCVPCKKEHPVLMELAKTLPAGAAMWGIDMMDQAPGLAAMLKGDGNPFSRIGTDPAGTAGVAWGVDGIPATYVVDEKGRLIYRHFGPITAEEAVTDIVPLLRGN